MRILVVTHYFPEHGGGVEIAAHHIAKGLARRDFTIEWIASRESIAANTDAPGARPVPAMNAAERWLGVPYPLWGPSGWRAVIEGVRRADVVHLHDTLYAGNLLAFVAAHRRGKPVVITQHVGHVPYTSRLLSGAMSLANHVIAASVLKRASRVIVYSKTTEHYFQGLIPGGFSTTWIANGLDLSLYRPLSTEERRALRAELNLSDGRPILLFVGRFVEKKGMSILRTLVSMFPDTTWVFAGWGPDDPSRWAAANVRVAGRCTRGQVARLYQAADLLILPSVGEGFPLVVQESMACGTPVAVSNEVAGAYPGLRSMVWCSEPAVGAFQALLQPLLANPAMLEQRRGPSASFARKEWSWDVCVDQYEALMKDVVARTR
jgi:glycosyltransferase involved in cell wall biosynthesis